jgi:CBS domain-containing protein
MAEQTVRDIMTKDLVTAAPEWSVTDAAKTMVDKHIGSLPVVKGDELVGFVTEGDLIIRDIKLEYPTYLHLLDGFIMYPGATSKFEHELKKAVAATVGDVMTPDPVTIQASATIEDLATLLVERNLSKVPVLEGAALVGVVTKSDVLRAIVGGAGQ